MRDSFIDDLLAYRLPVHLVLDGAKVVNLGGADIAERLTSHGLVGRPLFRDTAHRPTVLAGPWLISFGMDNASVERGTGLARQIGKGVFWLGEPDSEMLFRHLRKLGAARLPDGRILYFRHYDSDVLAAIVPLVDEEQAAHLFGPTHVIAFIGGCGDGATVVKPDGLPEPRPGPIAFYEWQIEVLDDRQRALSRGKIASLVRLEFPTSTKDLSIKELEERVAAYETEGRSLNLTTEKSLAHWARLNFFTRGAASRNESLKTRISALPPSHTDGVFVRSMPRLMNEYENEKATSERGLEMTHARRV